MDILQMLQELDQITMDFDITIDASNLDISRIARFCGERAWEFYVYQTEDKKLIRIRK